MPTPRPLPTQDERDAIREGVRAVITRFDDEYWLARDDDGAFPFAFHRAMADAGWLVLRASAHRRISLMIS